MKTFSKPSSSPLRDNGEETTKKAASLSSDVTKLLNHIKQHMENLNATKALTWNEALEWSEKSKVAIPFAGKVNSECTNIKLLADAPSKTVVVGSFLLDTVVAPGNVDLAIEMPMSIFEPKDELNYRYFIKRAYYLARIADHLKGLAELSEAVFTWIPFRGHALKPILSIEPKHLPIQIKIHTSIPDGVFKLNRFAPSKSLVRKAVAKETSPYPQMHDINLENIKDLPSPIYNSLILSDMLMVDHLKLVHYECKRVVALRDAIKLGKAWIAQRNYREYSYQFDGFQLSMLMVFLIKTETIDVCMNEIQIFKTLMKFLAKADLTDPKFFEPISTMKFIPSDCKIDYSTTNYKEAFTASLVEPNAGLNVLFDWTAEGASLVKFDAQRALEMLNEETFWQNLFLKPESPFSKFDRYYKINTPSIILGVEPNFRHFASELVPQVARMKMVSKKLKIGLGDRAAQIFVFSKKASPSSSSSNGLESFKFDQDILVIALTLNRDKSQKLVELGPLADEKVATQVFRHFWKDRAELRRFPDGSIREAVAWDKFKEKRHLIVKDIIKFVIDKHVGLVRDSLDFVDGKFDFACSPNSTFQPFNEALDLLSKSLKSIDSLPLKITRCESTSPAARLTLVNAPQTFDQVSFLSPIHETLIYFEKSGKWPSDYYGLLYAKQAFAVQLCQQLEDRFGMKTFVSDHFVDVNCNGFIFRCFINTGLEIEVSKEVGAGNDIKNTFRRYEFLPNHSRTISALAQANSLYGPTCRLTKYLIASQGLSNYIPEELIELLVVCAFQSEIAPPNSIEAGFYRVLDLIANYSWFGESGSFLSSEANLKTKSSTVNATKSPINSILSCNAFKIKGMAMWYEGQIIDQEDFEHLQNLAKTIMATIDSKQQLNDWKNLFTTSFDRPKWTIVLESAENIQSSVSKRTFVDLLAGFDPYGRALSDLVSTFPTCRFYSNSMEPAIIRVHLDEAISFKVFKSKALELLSGLVRWIS